MSCAWIRASLSLVWWAVVAWHATAAGGELVVKPLPDLPAAIASFGAAELDGQLFVYGGHTGGAHEHSIENLSTRFVALALDKPSAGWRELPMGTLLQSPALVAHGGALIRLGGMLARNHKGEPEQTESVAEVERFDPASGAWTKLAPLPEARSSHDVVVVGDTLYVIGGWTLGPNEPTWLDTTWKLDLKSPEAQWRPAAKAPIQRRAFAAAALDGKIYVPGGITPNAGPTPRVDVYDVRADRWEQAPDLPGDKGAGFGCASCAFDGRLYATTLDGGLHRLSADGQRWERAGTLQPSRFLHRLTPAREGIVCIGGASMSEGHLASVVVLRPQAAADGAE